MISEIINELKKENYSIISYKENNYYKSKLDGIKPVLFKINEDREFFKDAIVVDKVIGKASASLLALSHVKEVHALVLSQSGKDIFEKYHIKYSYETLVPYIINRKNDGMCPMEMTVKDIDDLNECYKALNDKVIELSKQN